MIHHEYLMNGELATPLILYLIEHKTKLWGLKGRCAGGRRTEFFNMQCILWEQNEDIQAVTDTQQDIQAT